MAKSQSQKTWDETLADFEDYLLQKGRAKNSVDTYAIILKSFGKFYRENLEKPGPYPSRLQETDIHSFIDHLRSKRYLAASSVNCTISALHAFSRYLLEKGKHKRDIAKDLRTYYVGFSLKSEPLSHNEVNRLVTSIDLNSRHGFRDLAIMQLLLQCGLRIGEITRLSVNDVMIRKNKGTIRIRDEKTRSDRFVPLNASVRSALKTYLDVCEKSSGNTPLFRSQKNKQISTKTIQYLVKKYLCAAGRSELSAGDLRHHFALGVYKNNKSLPVVQQILGHRNLATTARYIQPTEEELSQAVEKLPDNIYHGETQK